MQTAIHPTYFPKAKVTCACGNTFIVGSTQPDIQVEVCSNCHPFYTNKMRFVDTAGRVDAFKAKKAQAKKKVLSKAQRRELKREKRMQKELSRPDTLAELRAKIKVTGKKKAAKKTSAKKAKAKSN